jgi:putative ABC transport system permease protein
VPIPFVYNLLSVRARWTSTLVAVVGIGGTVGVFLFMLALANGFRATLVASGSPGNAIVRRAGASAEMDSAIGIDEVRILEDAPGVARTSAGALVSAEVVVIAAFPLQSTGTDANVQVRGVSPRALEVRDTVRLAKGRFFRPGLAELVVGRNVAGAYRGLSLGSTVRFGGSSWSVVGVVDAGGSAFDSEVWCDADVLNQVYLRPRGVYQSVTARLTSAAAFPFFKDAVTADRRLRAQVDREIDYYARQSQQLTMLITVLGSLLATIMGIGAVFAALNTMYSAVSERAREIATLRAIGFGAGSVVLSFVLESLLVAFVGGVAGCLAALPLNGLTTGTELADVLAPGLRLPDHPAAARRRTPVRARDGSRRRPPTRGTRRAPACIRRTARTVKWPADLERRRRNSQVNVAGTWRAGLARRGRRGAPLVLALICASMRLIALRAIRAGQARPLRRLPPQPPTPRIS